MTEHVKTSIAAVAPEIPFETELLDDLLDKAGIDALIVTSKHNIQYLVGGGYRFFFFSHFDAIGLSRYLPMLVYLKGRPDRTTYIGHPMEAYERDLGKFWMSIQPAAKGSIDAMQLAIDHLRKHGGDLRSIGVERAFLPADAEELLRNALPVKIVDALGPLERLRAVKTVTELGYLRVASELVVDAMLAVVATHGPGSTKLELTEALRREEVNRGLTFEYCLITTGTSLNRAPSEEVWGEGDILSLDSGGNYKGYIGDLCRMAIQGDPDAELVDLLAEIDAIQMAARKPIKAGARGGDIYASASEVLNTSSNGNSLEFVAHGMGLVTHEIPHLSNRAPVPYPASDAELPLRSGMVLSIETTLHHPRRGFIKLEDTLAVTETGWEAFGDGGRSWNRGGTARRS